MTGARQHDALRPARRREKARLPTILAVLVATLSSSTHRGRPIPVDHEFTAGKRHITAVPPPLLTANEYHRCVKRVIRARWRGPGRCRRRPCRAGNKSDRTPVHDPPARCLAVVLALKLGLPSRRAVTVIRPARRCI